MGLQQERSKPRRACQGPAPVGLSAGPFHVGSPPHPALSPHGGEGLQASLLVRERGLLDELHLDLTADGAGERHGIECAAT
jgi:hypothetical protein